MSTQEGVEQQISSRNLDEVEDTRKLDADKAKGGGIHILEIPTSMQNYLTGEKPRN